MADNGSVQIWVACITAAASISASVIAASKLDLFRLSGNSQPAATAPIAPAPAPGGGTVSVTPPQPAPPAPETINITGKWIADSGAVAMLQQTGATTFTIPSGYIPEDGQQVPFVGTGTINGRTVSWQVQLQVQQNPLVSTCSGILSADQRTIQASCNSNNGTGPLNLTRM